MTYINAQQLINELENPFSSSYSTQGGLIVFDGVCNICNGSMRFVDHWNNSETVQMGWAQDPTVIHDLLAYYHITNESILNSFAFIEKPNKIHNTKSNSNENTNSKSNINNMNNMNNSNRRITNCQIYRGSTAWCHIAKYFSFPMNYLYYLIYIPLFIREFCYHTIANNRYKWFGKSDYCQRPTKSLTKRMVHPIIINTKNTSNSNNNGASINNVKKNERNGNNMDGIIIENDSKLH